MTTVTPTRIGMPLDEFLELGSQQAFELIDGERIPKLPNKYGHGEVSDTLYQALLAYSANVNSGRAHMEVTFILPDAYDSNWVTGSRIPDVMFYVGDRIVRYKAETPDYRDRPLTLVPDLVIEVVSPNDKVTELEKKIDLYLADGVRLIWVMNPEVRKVTIHAPDLENPIVLKGDTVLDGGEVLPGFQIRLATLFG
jgi:Uma2 family endonuclease